MDERQEERRIFYDKEAIKNPILILCLLSPSHVSLLRRVVFRSEEDFLDWMFRHDIAQTTPCFNPEFREMQRACEITQA